MMDLYRKYPINQCEPINYCTNIDDFRPVQSALLTRFTTADCSELWRTTNQDYGAFYYRQLPQSCIPDNLKAKIYQRQSRFQDWLYYQNLIKNDKNCNNRTIFPSDKNDTVRITHRKRCSPKFHDTFCDNQQNQNTFSSCGEDGLITEFIVKKILHKLQCLIGPDECHDVAACAQLLVSGILSQEPCLLANEIIDRVINIMITPPNNIEQKMFNPCCSYISTTPVCCPSPQLVPNNCQTTQPSDIINNELPLCATLNTTDPLINCSQTTPLSNGFEKLNHLENAISKVSNNLVK
ncbi:unnamed protein product [Rotaria socialis]|uniref:Uncharacterized protein n=2 Tax=Rotaria socialis TaxID=392032 RepID=A0A821FUF9_9BILA|nr:unnamed protein product [Rotaria socialis]